MAFQELMTKHNLLGGRYSVPPTCPPSPPPTATARKSPESTSPARTSPERTSPERTSPERTSPARTSASPSPKRKRTNFIASSEVLPKNNRIQTNTGFMLIEERDPETDENIDSLSQNDLGEALGRIGKQRRMASRLKDPIVVKTQNRKQKTNLNAFKSKFLTLKKKVSALQMEVGTEPDFLILVRNNLQDPLLPNPSKMAGKYMCYGNGEISDLFFKSGIKFSASDMYKLANNFNYAEEILSEVNETQECNTNTREAPKMASQKRKNQPNKTTKRHEKENSSHRPATPAANYRPRKVFTPGSRFLDNLSDMSENEEEVEPVRTENQLRKGDEIEDVCVVETSIEYEEGGEERA